MKQIKSTLAVIMALILVLSFNMLAFAQTESKKDVNSPTCYLTVGSSVGLGGENTGMFLIVDESPLSDYEITPDDVVVYGVGDIEILSVYEPVIEYDEINESYAYRINFTYKGTVVGNCYCYIDACAVTDEAGNMNWPSQSKPLHIGVIPGYESEIIEYIFLLLSQLIMMPFRFISYILGVI